MTNAQDFGCLSGADRAPNNSNSPGQTEIVMCTELLATMHRELVVLLQPDARQKIMLSLGANLTDARTGGIVDLMEGTFRRELCYRGLF